jgi:hypothetical protein
MYGVDIEHRVVLGPTLHVWPPHLCSLSTRLGIGGVRGQVEVMRQMKYVARHQILTNKEKLAFQLFRSRIGLRSNRVELAAIRMR